MTNKCRGICGVRCIGNKRDLTSNSFLINHDELLITSKYLSNNAFSENIDGGL
jgi:hypothetical protein